MSATFRIVGGNAAASLHAKLKTALDERIDHWADQVLSRFDNQERRMQACLARMGNLSVRLARGPIDLRRIQRLRYDIFYEGTQAKPHAWTRLTRRDADAYDALCDHLLVSDSEGRGDAPPRIVGTYRLLGQDVALRHRGFYSATEFDIAPLLANNPDIRMLELGRSCVLPSHRNKRTIELLWQGISVYLHQRGYNVMMGCASFPGTDPDRLALPLSFLHHHARADGRWAVRARPERYVEMNRMPMEAIDPKAALKELPPLIKGYLRLGARFGSGAVIDHEFGTTDVFVIMPLAGIGSRYREHFAPGRQLDAA